MYLSPIALKEERKKHKNMLEDPNTTILCLNGNVVDYFGENRVVNGIFMLEKWLDEVYRCIPVEAPTENGYDCIFSLKRREILKILKSVVKTKDPSRWSTKKQFLYWDSKQDPIEFDITLLYIVVMLVLTIFKIRFFGWILSTVLYFGYKSSKFN